MAKTVLIVEDNELNMKLFRDLLEAHGYQTSGTSNGYEALDLVRKMRPDLILMDIQLPQVSGLEVTKWIKDDPDLRAIPVDADRMILHALPREYVVDAQDGIRDPVGMSGVRLQVRVNLVTATTSCVQNVIRCVER